MRLRGYEGRLRVTPPPRTRPAFDAALVVGAFLVTASSVGWRVFSAALNPFSWLAPASALVLLLLALIASRRTTR